MTKKLKLPIGILTVLAVFLAALLFLPLGATDGFAITASAEADTITPSQPTGDGSVGSPYQIGTAAELYWFAAQVNSGSTTINAVLTANITVNTGVLKADGSFTALDGFTSWTPIGNSSNQYTGTFNGNDHTVSGLFFYNTSTDYVGLFGYIGSGGRVSNVGVVESCLYGADYVGGISGRNYGAIESCYNASFISSDNSQPYIGGVCGKNYGTIKNCYNRGKAFLCGVCGENYNGTLENCYNAGTLMGGARGVCGSNTGTITNCYFLNTSVTDVNAIGKSAEEFASGEVAYLLQGEQETAVWGQNIDNGAEIQAYPVLGGAKVYHGYAENDPSALIYSNSELNEDTHVHSYENGFCKVCSNYDAAAKNNSGVYEISNAGQLYWFAQQVNSGDINIKAILTQDITVNNGDVAGCKGTKAENWKEWTPIGNNSSSYTGTFDGNNKTISGLYFNNAQASYVGLFGYIGKDGSVSDVGVINSYINGNEKVGGVCGNNGGTITSCYNTGTVSGTRYTGGVCGYNNYGTIKSCYNTGAVSGTGSFIGGVCAENEGTIENSYNTGAVSSKASYVGGVCGQNIDNIIKNCYNTGAVSGSKHVGGVCGDNVIGTIVNCYNTGAVSGNEKVGGVCGSLGGTIANCYFDSTAYSGIAVGTIIDGVVSGNVLGKATAKFTGGEVAYLLWQGCTVNEVTYDGSVWGQTIGTDLSPVFSGAKVYPCTEGCTAKYANTEGATGEHTAPDTYDNGFGKCTDCNVDLYQPATLNNGVYEISNAGQLYWFADKVNNDYDNYKSANAVLTADITVNSNLLSSLETDESGNITSDTTGFRSWTPIGNDDNQYTGIFNGNNHTVSGLYLFSNNYTYPVIAGLFGVIGNNGNVSNVGVVDSYFYSPASVGGVCGWNNGGTIESCYNTGKVFAYNMYARGGGVCGQNDGIIRKCHNTGAVSGIDASTVGGVCGLNEGTIENCYNKGGVSGIGCSDVGGVCGGNSAFYRTATITNCYNAGFVTGSRNVGGVCGDNYTPESGNTQAIITNCYYLEGCKAEGTTFTNSYGEVKDLSYFQSGEVAFLLQGEQTTAVWGQTIGTDNYPVLGGDKVYQTLGCVGYSNTENETKEHKDDIEPNDGVCDVCNAKFAYIVSLLSEADGTSSVANPSGGGKFNAGETTTITAEALPGYTFNGWYNGDTLVNANLSFEFTVGEEDVTFTAKYTANVEMLITINGGESYSVAVNNLEPSNFSGQKKTNYAVGTKLTLTANGADFAYWENEAGSVLSRSASYTFTVVNSATVTAVYNTKTADKATVIFISGYDQIIARDQYASGEDVPVPSAPTKTGCDFAGWSVNGTVVAPADYETTADYTTAVKTAIKNAITEVLATDSTTDDIINVKATYTVKNETVEVTVTNGTGAGIYTINTVVTVTANAPEEGKKFSHWTDGTNTLSYNTSYSFYAAKDIELTAVYVEEAVEVEAVGTTEMVSATRENGVTTFVSLSTVPQGCTIVKAGVIVTNVEADSTTLTEANAKYIRGDAWSGTTYRYTLNITTSKTYYAKAYLVYTDKNGNTKTVYGDLVTVNA